MSRFLVFTKNELKAIDEALCAFNPFDDDFYDGDEQQKLKTMRDRLIREAHAVVYPQPSWNDCIKLSEHPLVDETIRNFLEDPHQDNAVCMVRTILEHGGV